MANSITNFKERFNGGTRLNRFVVEGNIPGNGSFSKFHIRATQIPILSTPSLEYNYFGRKKFYPSEKQYPAWSVIVLDDITENGNMWKKFSNWHDKINSHDTNISTIPGVGSDYKAYGWKIKHLSLNGEKDEPLKTFTLHGCWPRTVGSIGFNMGNPNALNQFPVVFLFDWIEIDDITTA
jgi:hypothetical protein